jgi:hypothetical protein
MLQELLRELLALLWRALKGQGCVWGHFAVEANIPWQWCAAGQHTCLPDATCGVLLHWSQADDGSLMQPLCVVWLHRCTSRIKVLW